MASLAAMGIIAAPAVSAGAEFGAASLAAGVVGAAGQVEQGNAASAAAGYNAQVAANNAQIATQNAQTVAAQGEQNVGAAGAQTKAAVAATLANQGASGVDVNSGSSVDYRESESKLGMLNALNVRSQAAQTAYGYQTQAAAFTGQESLAKSEQESDQIGGYLNAGSTVLGGIGNAAKYSTWLGSGGATAGLTADNNALSEFGSVGGLAG